MKYKITPQNIVKGNIYSAVKNKGQKTMVANTTASYYDGETITSVAVSSTLIDLKSGDKINIGGQLLTLDADAAATSTSLSVSSTALDFDINIQDLVEIDMTNLFVQYQRKSEGTIAGMPVTSDSLGKLEYKGGTYTFPGVDPLYLKILPRDFLINEDGGYEALEFKDASNTGLQVGDADQEMVATVNIPYGTTATHVAVWGSVTTKVVDVHECTVSANGKSAALGSGTTDGNPITITSTAATEYNYLLIIVKVTATSNRVYGGKVTLTQN